MYQLTNFLPPSISNEVIDELEEQDNCFQGDQYTTSTPWLRCPSMEHQSILPFSPVVEEIRDYIKEYRGYDTNIAEIQKYKDEEYPHSDKILDLDPDTPIFILRFGATRTCLLEHKVTKEIIHVDMPHNSCLVIEYSSNLEWKHGIVKQPNLADSSYAIVFRNSVTFKTDSGFIYGEHTPMKTYKDLIQFMAGKEALMSHDEYSKKIVECYCQENKNIATLDIYNDIIENSLHPY